MLFPLLLQGPDIEPLKFALKLDTLTIHLLGTIYTSVEISRSDKALKKASTGVCGQSLFHVDALFNILSN